MTRRISSAVVLMLFLSCAGRSPDLRPEGTPGQRREELVERIRTLESEKNDKEIRKAGLKYIREFPDGPEIVEITMLTGSAGIELGYLSEARSLLLPLAGEEVESSARGSALLMLAAIDRAKGLFHDSALELLSAMSLELDQAKSDSARSALEEVAALLSAPQLEGLRVEYPSSNGIDIILDACMSFAAVGADSAYMDSLRFQIASMDSLQIVPDRVAAHSYVLSRPVSETGGTAGLFRIGLLCPLSGRFSPLGQAFLSGASLAIKESRMRGKGEIELVVGDTRADALEARSIVERMISRENVSALVGDILSSTTIAAAQVAQYNGVVLFSPVASETGIDVIGDFVFQAATDSEAEIHALARVACVNMGLTRFAFLSADNLRSRVMESLFRRSVEYHGASLVASDFYDEGSTDFLVYIDNIRKADPEALFIASDTEDLILILPQLSFYEFGVQLLGTSAWNSRNLLRMAGRDMAGAVFPAESDVNGNERMYRSAAAFTGEQAGDVNRFSVAGYSGVRRVLEAMALSSASGGALRDEMERSLKSRRHQYIEMLTGEGLHFNTVRNEIVLRYTTLRTEP